MAMHPAVQRKAQDALDGAIGKSRLPEHGDLANLPYLRAILLETLRWRPILPFGVIHALSADDTYNGFDIPKGTAIIAVSPTSHMCLKLKTDCWSSRMSGKLRRRSGLTDGC